METEEVKYTFRFGMFLLIVGLAGRAETQYFAPMEMHDTLSTMSDGVTAGTGLRAMDDARSAVDAYGRTIQPGRVLTPEERAMMRQSTRGDEYGRYDQAQRGILQASQREQSLYEQKKSEYEEDRRAETAREEFWTQLAEQIEQRDQEEAMAQPSPSAPRTTAPEEIQTRDVPIELLAIAQNGLVAYIRKSVWDILSVQQKGLLEEKFDRVELLTDLD